MNIYSTTRVLIMEDFGMGLNSKRITHVVSVCKCFHEGVNDLREKIRVNKSTRTGVHSGTPLFLFDSYEHACLVKRIDASTVLLDWSRDTFDRQGL